MTAMDESSTVMANLNVPARFDTEVVAMGMHWVWSSDQSSRVDFESAVILDRIRDNEWMRSSEEEEDKCWLQPLARYTLIDL